VVFARTSCAWQVRKAMPIEARMDTPRRILVVEDNYDAAESLRLVLELSGHAVAVAHTGQDGLDTARAFNPDVVLCDIGLPEGMSGYGFARALRESGADKVHLIALTGYGRREDEREALDAGFNQHLVKPVDPGALKRILANL
jgi:CheY-like chemotaxis protein